MASGRLVCLCRQIRTSFLPLQRLCTEKLSILAQLHLLMLTKSNKHGLVQLLPDNGGTPTTKASPSCHVAEWQRNVLPWKAVRSKNRMLLRAFSSHTLSLLAPTLTDELNAGIRGRSCLPNSLRTGYVAMKESSMNATSRPQRETVWAVLFRWIQWELTAYTSNLHAQIY